MSALLILLAVLLGAVGVYFTLDSILERGRAVQRRRAQERGYE